MRGSRRVLTQTVATIDAGLHAGWGWVTAALLQSAPAAAAVAVWHAAQAQYACLMEPGKSDRTIMGEQYALLQAGKHQPPQCVGCTAASFTAAKASHQAARTCPNGPAEHHSELEAPGTCIVFTLLMAAAVEHRPGSGTRAPPPPLHLLLNVATRPAVL